MLANHRKLKLQPLEIEAFDHKAILDDFEIDLGSQVQLEELNLTDGKINCHGSITVISPEMN
jgi:hypothetical protein